MRRWTLVTLILLIIALGVAATAQVIIANRHHAPYPGPRMSPSLGP